MMGKEYIVPEADCGGEYFGYSELIRCKDCKHRPEYDNRKRITPPVMEVEYDDDGEPWVWDDDMTCPYLCGDSYYNQMPDDEQFCDRGERRESEQGPIQQ